jgi:hypothetical protein
MNAWKTFERDTRPVGTRRTFAAKRLYIIAQGFSPGLAVQKDRPESGGRGRTFGGLAGRRDRSRADRSSYDIEVAPCPVGRHFQGAFVGKLTQG